MKHWSLLFLLSVGMIMCNREDDAPPSNPVDIIVGADLSYVNQIIDHGGVYKDQGVETNPYVLFKNHGTDLVRFRLWNNPLWTKDVYGAAGTQLYNDFADVEKSISLTKAQGMKVLLDFHYSDTWADPGKQEIPDAWKAITSLSVLKDSVYNYTFKTLKKLKDKNLLPEFVQLGNEINCGMLFTNAPAGFPTCNACGNQWSALGEVINSAVKAVRDISVNIKIILHVADPKNVEWWFDNIKANGGVTDYDVVGFSYYPLWHTTVTLDQLSEKIALFRLRYGKEVMIMETAYPWTTQSIDSYTNIFGNVANLTGYPFTVKGQTDFLKALAKEVGDGKGLGFVYWEPAWITSNLKDLWGTGSSWENCTYFDFSGNVTQSIDFMNN